MKYPLKDLVTKLNDRNIQRQRESGLTLYAILGLAIYIAYSVLEGIPNFQTNLQDQIVVLTLFGNVLFCLLFFLIFIMGARKQNATRVYEKVDFMSIDMEDVPLLLVSMILSCLNIYSFGHSQSTSWTYLMFGIIIGLNSLSPLAIRIYLWWRDRKSILKIPDFTFLNSVKKSVVRSTTFVYGILFAIPLAILIRNEIVDLNEKDLISLIRFDAYLFGLFFIATVMLQMYANRDIYDRLEQLEKDIFLYELEDEVIKERLEDEYFGQTLPAWVEKRKEQISNYFKTLIARLREVSEACSFIDNAELSGEDKQNIYLRLFLARQELVGHSIKYNKDFDSQLRYIRLFSSIEANELVYLNDLQIHYNHELKVMAEFDKHLYVLFNAVQQCNGDVGRYLAQQASNE